MAQTKVTIDELEAQADALLEAAQLFREAAEKARQGGVDSVMLHWKSASTQYIPGVLDVSGKLAAAVREAVAAKRAGRPTKAEMEKVKAVQNAKRLAKGKK